MKCVSALSENCKVKLPVAIHRSLWDSMEPSRGPEVVFSPHTHTLRSRRSDHLNLASLSFRHPPCVCKLMCCELHVGDSPIIVCIGCKLFVEKLEQSTHSVCLMDLNKQLCLLADAPSQQPFANLEQLAAALIYYVPTQHSSIFILWATWRCWCPWDLRYRCAFCFCPLSHLGV